MLRQSLHDRGPGVARLRMRRHRGQCLKLQARRMQKKKWSQATFWMVMLFRRPTLHGADGELSGVAETMLLPVAIGATGGFCSHWKVPLHRAFAPRPHPPPSTDCHRVGSRDGCSSAHAGMFRLSGVGPGMAGHSPLPGKGFFGNLAWVEGGSARQQNIRNITVQSGSLASTATGSYRHDEM